MTSGVKDHLHLIQINLNHSPHATDLFTLKFHGENFDIGMLQEPYCIKRRVRNVNRCNVLFKTNCNSPPRAALVFRRGIKFTPLTQFITKDLVAALVDTKDFRGMSNKYVICSSYHDGNKNAIPADYERLVQYCNETDTQLIYGCDSNSHHELWGSKVTDTRGQELIESIIMENLIICNKGSKPT